MTEELGVQNKDNYRSPLTRIPCTCLENGRGGASFG